MPLPGINPFYRWFLKAEGSWEIPKLGRRDIVGKKIGHPSSRKQGKQAHVTTFTYLTQHYVS